MKRNQITAIILAGLALVGCDSETVTSQQFTTIEGLASYGGAIKGTVSIKENTQASTVMQRASTPLSVFDNGKFTINQSDKLTYPVLLKIEGVHGIEASTEYSLLLNNESGRINLSPLTRLVINHISGVDAKVVFNNFPLYQHLFTEDAITEAQEALNHVIEPLLIAANLDDELNLFTASYEANHTHLDSVLSTLRVEYKEDRATLTYLPNPAFQIELTYKESWSNLSLIPAGSDTATLKQDLNVIHQAKRILDSMILLKDDQAQFNTHLAPKAHWFGSSTETLHDTYFDILPAENDATFKRYRDFVILDSQPNRQRYLLGYTTTFEASTRSSIARDQAWFEFVDGELKFLGEEQPFPTSFYALYKLNYAPKEYNWVEQDAFNWVFETTGFLSSTYCTEALDRGDWQWGSNDFIASLPSVSDVFNGLQYITVTSPTSINIKLDKIFRDPYDGGCHLVDSENKISGLLDGYPIDLNLDRIEMNAQYTIDYVYDSQTMSKKIFLTQPPENIEMMSEYIADLKYINGSKGEFYYNWDRHSAFVSEGDLYIYTPSFASSGQRISIKTGETAVSTNTNDDVIRVFHSAFDPYGRVINNYYVSRDGVSPLQ